MNRRVDQSDSATLVNVLGTGGSGTTMLGLMIGSGPEGFAGGEIRVWYRPLQPPHFHDACWCRQDPCPVWSRVGGFPAEGVHARIAELTGARAITDTSKWFDWQRDASEWAREAGMAVRDVVVWRRPLELVQTMWRRGRLGGSEGSPPTGSDLATRALTALHTRYCRYYESLLDDPEIDPVVVSFEDLLDQPGPILRRVCETIGIGFAEGQERFWEHEHHTLFGNQTARETLLGRAEPLKPPRRIPEFENASSELRPRLESDQQANATTERLRAASIEAR